MVPVSQQIREAAGVVVDSLAAREPEVTLRDAAGLNVSSAFSALMASMADAGLTGLVRDAAAARAQFDMIVTVGAGLIAKRSERESGYAGLAAREGHRAPIGLMADARPS